MEETVHFLYIFMTKAVSYPHTGLTMDLVGFSLIKNHELNQLGSGLRLSENRGRKLITLFQEDLIQWMATGTLVVRPVKFSPNWNLEGRTCVCI